MAMSQQVSAAEEKPGECKRASEAGSVDAGPEPPLKKGKSEAVADEACAPPAPCSNAAGALRLSVAHSEDAGARQSMEDVAVVLLDARPPDQPQLSLSCAFAAVFDGHGGIEVAEMAAELLHTCALRAGLQQVMTQAASPEGAKLDVKAAKAAIIEGFASADRLILERCASNGWSSGACCVAAWLLGDTLMVANVGDAKAVLARVTDKDVGSVKAGSLRGVLLSKAHLAVTERARVQKAGGWVSADGRLNGRMQVSRSLGDCALKKSGCICTPDITAFALTPRDHFLLLACDGFWTVFDAQNAVDVASGLISEGLEPKAVTNRLINMAIRQRNCTDNCSVMLLQFVR